MYMLKPSRPICFANAISWRDRYEVKNKMFLFRTEQISFVKHAFSVSTHRFACSSWRAAHQKPLRHVPAFVRLECDPQSLPIRHLAAGVRHQKLRYTAARHMRRPVHAKACFVVPYELAAGYSFVLPVQYRRIIDISAVWAAARP